MTRTDDELKQIAKDIVCHAIFTDRHIPREMRQYELPIVFLPLALADEKTIEQMKAEDVDTIFEYYDKALPRSVNGLPCFSSMQWLNSEDAKKMWEYYRNVKEVIDQVNK